MAPPFLTAAWRKLIVINYEVDPTVLFPLLPLGTELDLYNDKALVSVIAFHFEDNKFIGKIPTFPITEFEEVNLRFYVRRTVGEEVRRGVVFVKEVVPSAIIAGTARTLYYEPYECRPMKHDFSLFSDEKGGSLSYTVTIGMRDATVSATTEGGLQDLTPNSIQEFILEHYWGYTKRPDASTSEYRVAHERWRYWDTSATLVDGALANLYPAEFRPFLETPPHSAFIALGSSVAVYTYNKVLPSYRTDAFPRSDVDGYVLYDGSCGFCSWWIPKLATTLQSAGFAVAPLQDSWVKETIPLSKQEILQDIRMLLKDGTLISGADAYIHAMKRLRWLKPLGLLLSLPGLRWLTWRCYQAFNRNRFLISKACNLSPHLP